MPHSSFFILSIGGRKNQSSQEQVITGPVSVNHTILFSIQFYLVKLEVLHFFGQSCCLLLLFRLESFFKPVTNPSVSIKRKVCCYPSIDVLVVSDVGIDEIKLPFYFHIHILVVVFNLNFKFRHCLMAL